MFHGAGLEANKQLVLKALEDYEAIEAGGVAVTGSATGPALSGAALTDTQASMTRALTMPEPKAVAKARGETFAQLATCASVESVSDVALPPPCSHVPAH